jgi:hypothetical protein
VIRLLRLSNRTRRWAKGACSVWSGLLNSAALVVLVILTLASIGCAFLFEGWHYCSLVQAGWFAQKSRRIALGPVNHPSLCREETWKNDFWLQHGLSVLKMERLHTFNMQDIWQATNFVLHALFGADVFSSVELMTSFDITTQRLRKRVLDVGWLFFVPTTMLGLMLDAFIFSVMARHMVAVGNFVSSTLVQRSLSQLNVTF